MKWPVLIWWIVTGYAVHGSQGAWGLLHLGWILCGKQAQPFIPSTAQQSSEILNLVFRTKVTSTCQSTLLRLEEKSLNRNKILKICHNWMWSFLCYLVYSCVLNSWEEKHGNHVSYWGRKPILGIKPCSPGYCFRKFRCLAWKGKFSLPCCRLMSSSMHISVCSV